MFRTILTRYRMRVCRSLVFLMVSAVLLSGCSLSRYLTSDQQSGKQQASSTATQQFQSGTPADGNAGGDSSVSGNTNTSVSGNGSVSVSTSQSQSNNGKVREQTQETLIKITADENTFSVQEITVARGTELILELISSGGEHSFVIDELGVDSGRIPLAHPRTLLIPTDQPGSYEYYSAIGLDRENGMSGRLTVTE